ncbi:MAG: PQQ-dependent sugar dehydrogenase [Chloroflexi bacterium]|nr:MAG: PQQ-dependent sugar dehydrogenase [Chloroflexota bacterium]
MEICYTSSMKMRTKKVAIGVLLLVAVIVTCALLFREQITSLLMQPTESSVPAGNQGVATSDVQTVAKNISTPWAMAKLPAGDILVTERSGQLQRIGQNGQTFTIEGVRETSEGGLLGLAIHPKFDDNGWIYLYSTTDQNNQLTNRIERYTLTDDQLQDRTVILDAIPASSNHDGGALAFGPDEKLYATAGDANLQQQAQDTASLAGKLLRMNDDGSAPADNPFGNLVWSYGHRNSQGITWDSKGQLWSTEHGPSGADTGRDELNLIVKGGNYGWPTVTGNETREGMIAPVSQSGDSDTWAPGGVAYHDGTLYFSGLRGQSLYTATIADDNTVQLKRHLTGEYGRLRAVMASDNQLYLSTSNNDGRGSPTSDDDRILRFNINAFGRR